jgi:hypothetical protein
MFNHNQALRFGAEHFYSNDDYHYNDTLTNLKDNLTALLLKETYISPRILPRKLVCVRNILRCSIK